jgi:hypothetical protein
MCESSVKSRESGKMALTAKIQRKDNISAISIAALEIE